MAVHNILLLAVLLTIGSVSVDAQTTSPYDFQKSNCIITVSPDYSMAIVNIYELSGTGLSFQYIDVERDDEGRVTIRKSESDIDLFKRYCQEFVQRLVTENDSARRSPLGELLK